jgi:hypothetical protein
MSVALVNQHANRMRRNVCGLSASTIFFHIISQTAQFSRKTLLNITCVFWFSLQPFSEIVRILTWIKQNIIMNVHIFQKVLKF